MNEPPNSSPSDGLTPAQREKYAFLLTLPLKIFLTGLFCLVIAGIVDSYNKNQLHVRSITCRHNLRQLGEAMQQYEEDNDGVFPSSRQWTDRIVPYLKGGSEAKNEALHCPEARDTPYGYAMNAAMSQVNVSKIEDHLFDTVLLFESNSKLRNADGGLRNVAWGRHYNGTYYAFGGGYARSLRDPATLSPSERPEVWWDVSPPEKK